MQIEACEQEQVGSAAGLIGRGSISLGGFTGLLKVAGVSGS